MCRVLSWILYTPRKYIEFGCQTFQINSPDVGFVKVIVQFINLYIYFCVHRSEKEVWLCCEVTTRDTWHVTRDGDACNAAADAGSAILVTFD